MRAPQVIAATAVALITSVAAPSALAVADPDGEVETSAAVTIAGLRAQGYTVSIDRVGSAPIEECRITNIRNPHEEWATGRDSDGERYEVLVSKTIIFSLAC